MKVQKSEIISESESKYSSSINQKISILEDYNEEFDSENKFEELGNFRKEK